MSRSSTVVGNAKTNATIAQIKDLSAAINDFKSRYHYLPGDMPQAGDNIPNLSAGCNIAVGATTTIGNGQVDTPTEVGCVAEELVRAGLIRGKTTGIFSSNNYGTNPDIFFTARRTTGLLPPTFPASTLNEIELTNQPCQTAQDIDTKLDDGNFATGNIMASLASCTPGDSTTDPVPYLDIGF